MKIGGYIFLLVLAFLASGCVSNSIDRLAFKPNDSESIVFSREKTKHHKAYFYCLYSLFVGGNSSSDKKMSKSEIYDTCATLQNNFYKSVYYTSFDGYQNKAVRNGDRHKTAIYAVVQSRKNAEKYAEEFVRNLEVSSDE